MRFRTYATAAYVPPASLEGLQRTRPPPPKPKPESPTFYTGRSTYYDQLLALESATKHTRTALQALELLPLPKFARENLPPLRSLWKNKIDLAELMNANLTTSRYRRFLAQLNQLNETKASKQQEWRKKNGKLQVGFALTASNQKFRQLNYRTRKPISTSWRTRFASGPCV